MNTDTAADNDLKEFTLEEDSSILLDSLRVALAAAMSSFLCGSFKSWIFQGNKSWIITWWIQCQFKLSDQEVTEPRNL